jgi:diguanylate cyclase (GGDEF)-like protein
VFILLSLSALLAAHAAMADGWETLRTTVTSNFTRERGLPHPVVMAMAEDPQGFLWLGTQGGLARFDGYRFHSYLHHDGDPASLPDDFVSALATDASGRLWVGTVTGEISWYDPALDGFHILAEPAGQRQRGAVNALVTDGADGLWAADNTGLDHIDAKGVVTRYSHIEGDSASLPSDRIRTVRVTKDGTVWVATYRGLVRRKPGESGFEPIPLVGLAGGVIDDAVIALNETEDGELWFITFQSQVGRLSEEDGPKAQTVYDLSQANQGGPSSYDMIEGRPGELWIGRISGGITRLDEKTGELRPIRYELGNDMGLADDAVRSLLKARNGLIWAGTMRGISIIDPDLRLVDNILPSSVSDHLPEANVLSLATSGQTAWLGLKEHGIASLDPEKGVIKPLALNSRMTPGSITALAAQPDGSLWVSAGTGQALYWIDAENSRTMPVLYPHDDTSMIVSMAWQDNALWIGAGPLMRFDPARGSWRVFRHSADPDSLTDDSATAMRFDGKGGLWVGTRRGLDHLDIASGKFTHSVHDPADPHSIPGDFIASMLIDKKGRLWVSALANGMAVAEASGADGPPRFHRISTADGLPNATVDAIEEDDHGFIWVSTDFGLAVIDPDSLKVRALGHDEGVAIPDYWNGSSAKLADGTLLFGGAEGLSVIHPERLSHQSVKAPLVITQARIGARSVPFATLGQSPLILGPRERNLEVEFAALDFTAPDKLRYQYQLEGFDEDWVASDSERRLAAYTNLPPGSYHLKLRATDRDGNWGAPLDIPVIVEPAWWQSWWFRLILALSAIGAIVGLVQLRTRFLLKRRKLLEKQVASQTRDLTEANERLKNLASRDSLTEIFNRRYFLELAAYELDRAKRNGRPVSLLMVDLDHFKRVNDTHGHAAGDDVLKGVVACIKAHLRDIDLFARIGGEELIVLMPETDLSAARLVAERLRIAIAATRFALSGEQVAITASFGLALAKQPPEPLPDLMERADQALYAAKRGGRNRVEEAG